MTPLTDKDWRTLYEEALPMIESLDHLKLGSEYPDYLDDFAPLLARAIRELQTELAIAQRAAVLACSEQVGCLMRGGHGYNCWGDLKPGGEFSDLEDCGVCKLLQAYAIARDEIGGGEGK